jgi:AraC family transcriptional regulator
MQVDIINFPETKVAVLEHHGDPASIDNSVRQFIEWRKQNNLPPSVSATFNIIYDNRSVAVNDFRLDICAATNNEISDNPMGIVAKTIPGGRCAVLRHIGNDDDIEEKLTYLYAQWLPQSNEKRRDFPMYFQRVSFFPAVPEQAAITDIFLPIASSAAID